MSYQAYLDNVKAKTGKTPEGFAILAAQKGLVKHGEIVKWLKSDYALGHGHATAIAGAVLQMGAPKASADERTSSLFRGTKEHWRAVCDSLIAKIRKSAPDLDVKIGGTYVSLLRGGKKFAILQPSSSDRLDVGIKLKGAPADARFEPAGTWNAMVTHRVRIQAASEVDEELLKWLSRAYVAAL